MEATLEQLPDTKVEIVIPRQISIPKSCYVDGRHNTIAFIDIPGVVNWLLDTHSIITILETDEILIYLGGTYLRFGDQIIKRLLEMAFGNQLNRKDKPILNKHIVAEILAKIRSRKLIYLRDLNIGLDPITKTPLLNVNNGVLNLKTRELQPHSPTFIFLNKLPVNYDPTATCPNYIAWRDDLVDKKFHNVLDEAMGSCLWPEYKLQKATMLYGKKRTGKGTWIRILLDMIGDYNCSHVTLQELGEHRYKVANLFGKMLNTAGDLPPRMVMDVGYFKNLTGEDTVEGEEKFKKAFNFKNRANLVFSANALPRLKIDDDAFYGRWIIIPFDRTFYGKEDASREDCLKTPEELSGILNLALDGLDRLRRNNWQPSYTIDAVNLYKRESNPIYAFLEDLYEPSDIGYVIKSDLLKAYIAWAKKHGKIPPKSAVAFGSIIKNNSFIPVDGIQVDVTTKKEKKQATRIFKDAWLGIRRKKTTKIIDI